MRTLDEIRENKHLSDVCVKDTDGSIIIVATIKFNRWKGKAIFDRTAGIEHVSISPKSKHIIPNWYDLVETKRIFWRPDETVVQFIPKDDEYVNVVKNCMHIWKLKGDQL